LRLQVNPRIGREGSVLPLASADEVFRRVHPRVPALLGARRNIVPAGERRGEEFAPAVTQLLCSG
jgi:hypothetical protein